MSNPQEAHYTRIHDAYRAHYYDAQALRYRQRFLLDRLCRGEALNGRRIADLASGSGFNSLLLKERFPTATFEGFDISSAACEDYERVVGAPAHRVDLTEPFAVAQAFDAAFVIGGLHHCADKLPAVFDNLAGLLASGGRVYMWEPNAAFVLQRLRDAWYRRDDYFEDETERALHLSEVRQAAGPRFREVRTEYFGGPAYFIILNSLILRVPLAFKGWVAPPLFAAEALYNRLPANKLFATFCSVWVKA